jgi:hypothetical protein
MSRTGIDPALDPRPEGDEPSVPRLSAEPNPDYAHAVTAIVAILDKANRRYRRLFTRAAKHRVRLEAQLDRIRSLVAEQHVTADNRKDAGLRLRRHLRLGGIDPGRGMSRSAGRLLISALILLLWAIDSTLLTVLGLTLLVTRSLTLVVVIASAWAAHIAGTTFRREHEAAWIEMSPQEHRMGRVSLVAGLIVEGSLAVIRALKIGGILSAVLLGGAGLAIFAAMTWVAYRSHSDVHDHAELWLRKDRAATRKVNSGQDLARKQRRCVSETLHDSRQLAGRVVSECDVVIEETRALWARENPARPVPVFVDPPLLVAWRRLEKGELPSALVPPPDFSPAISRPNEDPVNANGSGPQAISPLRALPKAGS